jgi:hypothetical protein
MGRKIGEKSKVDRRAKLSVDGERYERGMGVRRSNVDKKHYSWNYKSQKK